MNVVFFLRSSSIGLDITADTDSTSMNGITTTVYEQRLFRNEILDISQMKGLLIVR